MGYVAYVSVKLFSHFQVAVWISLKIGLFYKQGLTAEGRREEKLTSEELSTLILQSWKWTLYFLPKWM